MNWEQHFRKMNQKRKYSMEYSVMFGSDFDASNIPFGAEPITLPTPAPNTPIPNTNGAVIPPGLYWIETFDDSKGTTAKIQSWLKQKSEVTVVKKKEDKPSIFLPTRLLTIFKIPPSASNYGKPGVWFPTSELGLPSIADPNEVTAFDENAPRSKSALDVAKDTASATADTVKQVVKTVAKETAEIVGSGVEGAASGLSLQPSTLLKLGLIGIAIGLGFTFVMKSPAAFALKKLI